MRQFIVNAIAQLKTSNDWAKQFVDLKMDFQRKHGHGLITSTATGTDFFTTLLECIDGAIWDKKEHKGEYEDNFRKLIEIGRNELTTVS